MKNASIFFNCHWACDSTIMGLFLCSILLLVPSSTTSISNYIYLIPVVMIASSSLLVHPLNNNHIDSLATVRFAGLSTIFLAPFINWWFTYPNNHYLAACATLALLAFASYLIIFTSSILNCDLTEQTMLKKIASISHHSAVTIFAIIIAILFIFSIYSIGNHQISPAVLQLLWIKISLPLRILFIIYSSSTCYLLWQILNLATPQLNGEKYE